MSNDEPFAPLPSPGRERSPVRTRHLATHPDFDSFLLDLTTAFARAPFGTAALLIEVWLERLTHFLEVDQSSLWELVPENHSVHRRFVCSMPGIGGLTLMDPQYESSWITHHYLSGHMVNWARVPDDIPPEAVAEREWCTRLAIKSVLGIPTRVDTSMYVIVFNTLRDFRTWPQSEVQQLLLIVEIFAGAIARQRAEASLQLSEARTRAILKAQPDLIFIQDADGTYLEYHGGDPSVLIMPPEKFIGRNVREILPPELAENFMLAFTRASQTGEVVTVDYNLIMNGEELAFEARVVRRDDGALLTVVRNVSAHRNAQIEIERLRLELAHFGRVALTAQLTSSLAHELLQPISSISTNASVGQQILATHSVKGAEQAHEIFGDIIAGSEHAANVVHRVRRFLKKERRPHLRLELNRLIQEVADVMRTDLMLRRAHLELRLEDALPEISGDAVELQQVILNLLINAADAVAAQVPARRRLMITTARHGGEIEFIVLDSGAGIDAATLKRLFEPFFTTKQDGVGMGLAICADIIRSHRGRLWAENHPEGGAALHCLLPAA